MHHESLLAQIACRSLLEQLALRCKTPDEMKFIANSSRKSSQEHQDVIEKFGRYPSRNEILGRQSTEAELEFLKEHPSGFA
jgi:uncharacterized protein (DUF924 family)